MREIQVPGEGVLTTYIKVEKVDGRVFYYKVQEGKNIEIDKETYYREGGQ